MREIPDWDARSSTTIEKVLRAARSRLDRLSPQQAAREQQAEGALIVDIRSEPTRRAEGEIPGSLILERNVLEWRLDPTSTWRIEEAVDHSLRAIIVCPEGYVSSLAAAGLKDVGLHRATDVVGGFEAWREAGCPVVRSVTMAGSYVAAAPNPITLDSARQQMLVDGVPVALTRLEYRLMDELLRANGRVVTREELRSSIGDWPGSRSRSVDLHIHRIRRKLGPSAAALLATEWGVGFRLRARGYTEPQPQPHPQPHPQARQQDGAETTAALPGESDLDDVSIGPGPSAGDDDDIEGPGPVDAFDPAQFDVAGGGGA
jgi:rhodanese-related sulfurtransferase/DNA-binding winged helix-turn-helix (wHTH) protein